jgi:hypothetical protein
MSGLEGGLERSASDVHHTLCGVVPEVSLRVASLDGTAVELTVPQRGLVREVKRVVGQVRRGRLTVKLRNV